jgi:hypothetical protein
MELIQEECGRRGTPALQLQEAKNLAKKVQYTTLDLSELQELVNRKVRRLTSKAESCLCTAARWVCSGGPCSDTHFSRIRQWRRCAF